MKNNYINKSQDVRLAKIESHIETINSEMGGVKEVLTQMKTDLSWLKQSYWVITIASVGGLIGAFINLLFKK